MTSRTPRDSRLRLVPRQPISAVQRAVSTGPSRPAPRPPQGTPPLPELARQARQGLTGPVRLARWAAGEQTRPTGLRAGADGALPDSAARRAAKALGLAPREVRADWDRARLTGLVELHGTTARPGWRLRAWDRDDSAALRGWVALFDAWSLTRPAPRRRSAAAVAEVVEAVPQLLSLLHLSAGPVAVPVLLDMLEKRVTELRTERCEVPYADDAPAGAPAQPPATSDAATTDDLPALLAWALEALAGVGALVVREGSGAGAYPEGEAHLTALGNWAVWVKLEQICVAAQSTVGGNIEQSAEAMLRGCAGISPGQARAEYRAWLAARPVGSAVEELLAAARGEDALLRGLAFEALRVVGGPAESAVRAAVEEPVLRPYALMWLAVESEGGDPEDAQDVLTREESTWLWVDTAAAIADHGESGLLVRHLDSAVQGSVPRLLEEVRSVGHPRTVQVLVALAAAHPDPVLAKAVRKAAFQVHHGGSTPE
ncbi:hypothetical protein ACFV3R_28640 [Streptomyces sp. NPDC059740]|uniref:hypothetical protein n=1 Tax=Streptomyces sp. NPDC059740 TaxID=3346926 RepID=UPI00365B1286